MNNIVPFLLLVLSLSTLSTLAVFWFLSRSKRPEDTETTEQLEAKISAELQKKFELELEKQLLHKEKEYQQVISELQKELGSVQLKFEKKQDLLDEKSAKLESEKELIEQTKDELRIVKQDLLAKKDELDSALELHAQQAKAKLEDISQLTQEEARTILFEKTQRSVGQDFLDWQQKYLQEVVDEAHLKAREIVALAVQRCSSEVANEFTITTIKLQDDEQKGKIIGKGGRNIQWIEKILGVEIIIDDTPEIITISGFSSIRRHIAKRTIEMLLEDGRIHPASIEEMHEKAKAEIAQEIADAGQWAMQELGIIDFPAKLVRLIGRLKFRTSYGQNMLKHSVEMAKLAALLAHEMNAAFPHRIQPIDVDVCLKGALLHDIGKGVDEDVEPRTSHITLGEKIVDTFNLDWRIRKCISSHHDESYYDPEHGFCIEATIVDACDNISGGRIGARKETAEAYYQRMENLEKIANETKGVEKSWIMKGSRELWVFFDANVTTPADMHQATKDIAHRIQTDLTYPGEIKVIGFWEDKIVEYAH